MFISHIIIVFIQLPKLLKKIEARKQQKVAFSVDPPPLNKAKNATLFLFS